VILLLLPLFALAEAGIGGRWLGLLAFVGLIPAIDAAMAETGATGPADIGKLMGALKPKLAGQADMGQVSALVKQRLAG